MPVSRFSSKLCGLAIAIGLLTLLSPSTAEDWPQFLGPQRNGISTETGFVDSFPAAGPKEVWRVNGGVGMSGLAISRGRLITLVQADGKQKIIALNAQTGEPAWTSELGPEYRNQMGGGPRATPTIVHDRVFAFSGEGILAAFDFRDGKPLWSVNVVQELRGKPADYGLSCSPLVVGEQVIVSVGLTKGAVVAYDMTSGKLAWTAGDDIPGYSSPALLDVGGKPQIVACTGGSVLGLAPNTGAVLWRHPYETDFGCNTATPLAYKGQVFISSGENHGSVLLSLQPKGDKFDASEVWGSQGPKSVLRNEWQTSILLDGYLYGLDNVGGAGPITHLTCVKADTGERVWQKLRFGKGNLIAADGKLWFSTVKGELVLVRATPEKFEELGRAEVLGTTRQAPALANGLLYLRDDQKIVCLDVRK